MTDEGKYMGSEPAKPILLKGNEGARDLEVLAAVLGRFAEAHRIPGMSLDSHPISHLAGALWKARDVVIAAAEDGALSGGPGHGTGSTLEDAVHPQNPSAREAGRLREALAVAREALTNHACHGGPDAPCLRSLSDCTFECGKSAGDAIIQIEAALSTETGDQS